MTMLDESRQEKSAQLGVLIVSIFLKVILAGFTEPLSVHSQNIETRLISMMFEFLNVTKCFWLFQKFSNIMKVSKHLLNF